MAEANVVVGKDGDDVANKLCNFVIDIANRSIKERGLFTVGLSGGSLVNYLCKGLRNQTTDWSKWRIFFCDERHVPFDSEHSTYSLYRKNLVEIGVLEENIFPIDPNLSVEKCAEDYAQKMQKIFPGDGFPRFDMLLLGMGPDGHTCSLFPGHGLLEESVKVIAPISDSPKPPPSRVTMTFPVINNCRFAVFASCGASKAEIVQRVLEGKESPSLPAARVRPTDGELYWFLDKDAAANLKATNLKSNV